MSKNQTAQEGRKAALEEYPIYGVSEETMNALNDFSCKIESLKYSIIVLHSLLWGDVMEGKENAVEQAAHMAETLLEIVTIRDAEISEITGKVIPVYSQRGEGEKATLEAISRLLNLLSTENLESVYNLLLHMVTPSRKGGTRDE